MKLEIGQLINNYGQQVNYIKNLKKGDKLKAKVLVKSKGDIGMSMLTYDCEAFIPGNTYTVRHISSWDGNMVAYVTDEDGTLHFATPEIFDIIKQNKRKK